MTKVWDWNQNAFQLRLQVWVTFKDGTDKPYYGKWMTVDKNELVIDPVFVGGERVVISMDEIEYLTTDYDLVKEG